MKRINHNIGVTIDVLVQDIRLLSGNPSYGVYHIGYDTYRVGTEQSYVLCNAQSIIKTLVSDYDRYCMQVLLNSEIGEACDRILTEVVTGKRKRGK